MSSDGSFGAEVEMTGETRQPTERKPEWPKERPDGSWVWANGSLCMPPPGECAYCDSMRETPGPGGFFPSHNGSPYCYGHPYSIAKAGPTGQAHCTCDACF